MKKTNDTNWNAQLITETGFSGGCSTSFKLGTGHIVMAGLNRDPKTDADYKSIDFAWYARNGETLIYENGQFKKSFGKIHKSSDIFQIMYDNVNVKYILNGKVEYTSSVNLPQNTTLYFDSSISTYHATTPAISDFSFMPVGASGNTGAKGATGAKGSVGAKGAPGDISGFSKSQFFNYASDENWEIAEGRSQYSDNSTGGAFSVNGSVSENRVDFGTGPDGTPMKIWTATNQSSDRGADGGWNKNITGLNINKLYCSVIYFKIPEKATSDTHGYFYHGTGQGVDQIVTTTGKPQQSNGKDYWNPYFNVRPIKDLPHNQWLMSVGYIIPHTNPGDTTQAVALTGIYNCLTGAKIHTGTAWRFGKSGQQLSGGHRAYYYYNSTTSKLKINFAKPMFFEVNAMSPSAHDLLRVLSNPAQQDYYAPNQKSGYINVDSNAFVRIAGRGAGVGLLQEDAGGAFEVARFQNHAPTINGKTYRTNVMQFNYGKGWQYENTMTPGHMRIGKIPSDWPVSNATKHEGGELQLVATDDNIMSIDSFSDPDNYLKLGNTKYNFRFFNATNQQLYTVISEKGVGIKTGWLKIVNDTPNENKTATKHSHIILSKTYLGPDKTVAGFQLKKGGQYEHFRIATLNPDFEDMNPTSVIESTSLWFKNNEIYHGKDGIWNRSGDVKRDAKAALDPYGNFYSVRGFIANTRFSDRRLKKNINQISSSEALEKVKSLRGVTFRWKDESTDAEEGLKVGLIAQEVQKIVPEIVSTKSRIEGEVDEKNQPKFTDRLYVEYSRVVPLLIESVKELSNTIDSLKKEINDLKKS
jgi:hypothetical protein